MNRNHIKLIACLAMVIDHIGYVLFPQTEAFRILGRLAMPLFAFFIGEGCLHTRDKKKYFLRVLVLALICQWVYIAEAFITGSGDGLYLNILFTFSFSIILCFISMRAEKEKNIKWYLIFLLAAAGLWAMNILFEYIRVKKGIGLELDYGIEGILLPLFALVKMEKGKKLICFSVGLFFFSLSLYGFMTPYFIFAMLSLVPLCFYNGQGGKMNMKYFFYLFYPLHLAVIYGVNYFISL